jgi:8-oxo-dGTP pyrophosphatase MutT (NUDIX family)
VLLHRHPKLGKILPPGGHIEANELPEEAALREVREETGLDVELYQSRVVPPAADAAHLAMPETLLLEDIAEDHQHIDFIFFGTPRDPDAASRIGDQGEDGEFYWVDAAGLEDRTIPETVRVLGRDAIGKLGRTEQP